MQKLDPRELIPWGYAPGNYMGTCRTCGGMFYELDKRASCCERCAMIARYTQAEKFIESKKYLWE